MTVHQCPGPDCQEPIPYDMLACARHWYQVPKSVRNAVWRAWDQGNGAGTPEHDAAIALAIRSMRP